jgi:hypothetical protein
MPSFFSLHWIQALVAATHGIANNKDLPYATGLSDLLMRLSALSLSVEHFNSQGAIYMY